MRAFAQDLKTARQQAGFSLEEVAEDICSPSYLSLIEAGKRQPSQKMILALSAKLGIRPINKVGKSSSATKTFESINLAIRMGDFIFAKNSIKKLGTSLEARLLTALLHSAKGESTKAIREYEEVLFAEIEPTWIRFRALLGLIKTLRDFGQFQRAIQTGENALNEFSRDSSIEQEVIFELRAVLAGAYIETGDLERARELSDLDQNNVSPWQTVMSLWSQSMIENSAGNYEKALSTADKAVQLIKNIDRPLTEARLLNVSAAIELKAQNPNLDKAAASIDKAVNIFRELSFTVDLANSLSTKADLASFYGDAEQTKALYFESLALLSGTEYEVKGRIYAKAAKSYLRLGLLKECKESLLKARELLETTGANRTAAIVWRQMGAIYEQLGEEHLALACLKAATDLLGINGYSDVLQAQKPTTKAKSRLKATSS